MAQVRTMRADELAHACEIVAGQGLCEREEGLAMRLGPIAAGSSSASCCRPSTASRIS